MRRAARARTAGEAGRGAAACLCASRLPPPPPLRPAPPPRAAVGAGLFSDGPRAFGYTSHACAAACTGYRYFALQGGGQCFCGHALGRKAANHSKLADGKCGHVCAAEEGMAPPRLCGAAWRNAVYEESPAFAASAELVLPAPPAAAAKAAAPDAGGHRNLQRRVVRRGARMHWGRRRAKADASAARASKRLARGVGTLRH